MKEESKEKKSVLVGVDPAAIKKIPKHVIAKYNLFFIPVTDQDCARQVG